MKAYPIFGLLMLLWLSGCSQSDNHNFHLPGKIPIDAKRWYLLNNTSKGIEELFDGQQNQKINLGWGNLLKHYQAWYPLLDGEKITIDSIMMFDYEGTNEDHPLTVYSVDAEWRRIPIAVFTGMRYKAWNGPDPAKPDIYALPKPIDDVKYLVIDTWGDFPGELEFYGKYKPSVKASPLVKKYAPLHNFFGVNAFEWDFEDGGNAMNLDPKRLAGIQAFTGFRHYMDWEKLESTEGNYTFAPVKNGGWNYDAIYEWCQKQGMEVLPCLKTIPAWMQSSYPEGQREGENVPARYGKDLNEPASYIEQAKLAFQYAARYGANKNVPRELLKVDARPRWTNDVVNQVKEGLGLIKYIECENERDKWWKGRKAYQTGREYAANLSAFYDGDKGKLGVGVGVKNADPEMKVVMAGLAKPSFEYILGMIDWSKEHRGYKKDGSVDLPWDIINYHYYSNDAEFAPDNQQTIGVAPEMDKTAALAEKFDQMAHQYVGDMPVWVTEAGYDINEQSVQRAPAISGRSALDIQADWVLRTSLLYARSGVQKVFFYELMDDNIKNTTKYASSGLLNGDRSRRPAADYLLQVNKQFGNYAYIETINKSPLVDKYVNNNKIMYMLVMPDQKGSSMKYTLDLGAVTSANIYKPAPGKDVLDKQTQKVSGVKLELMVTETPVFVEKGD